MFDGIRNKISEVTDKVVNSAADLSDPSKIALLEHKLRQANKRKLEYFGLYHIYLRECTVLNRAVGKKNRAIKNLRAKVDRMIKNGAIDPLDKAKLEALVEAGVIDSATLRGKKFTSKDIPLIVRK